MSKVKKKRNSGLADKVHNKRKGDIHKKKLNPFEVHINREKLKVLGKKSKHDRGLPGVSRSKAIEKRKEVIGTEMLMMNKSSAFIDRRIGERNNQLSLEDRMVARFAAERSKQHNKKNIFNLADDEVLTHRGQTLEQIEKFDDPRSSDDEDDMDRKFGGLDNDLVSSHFSGGMLSKVDKDGAKSHKDLIEQLIAESKKRKAEKQKEKEQTLDLTEKLDSEWKDLQPVVFKRAKESEKESESLIDKVLSQAEKNSVDYDKMMRELKFEKRGTPSDGIKTDEKQAKEEKERLERLERERLQRMYDENENQTKVNAATRKHRSADDLDDDFEEDIGKEYMLAYDKDGKPLVPEHILKDYSVPNAKKLKANYDDGVEDTSSEEENNEESGGEESAGENDDEANASDNEDEENSDSESDSSEGIDSDKKKVKNIKSHESSGSSDDDESVIEEKQSEPQKKVDQNDNTHKVTAKSTKVDKENTVLFQKVENGSAKTSEDDDSSEESGDEESDEDEESSEVQKQSEPKKDDFADLKESEDEESSDDESVNEEDKEKIDSFFDIRASEGENLKDLLIDKTPSQQSITIQKLIKSYDPSLAENNKEKLSRLYARMLQYINDIFTNLTNEGDILKAFLVFDKLAPFFYDLSQTNKVSAKKYLVELLKEKHDKFQRNIKKVPDLDTLIFFKLVSLLYPTSDFKHPVTTPALVFMSEILTFSKFNTRYAISRGFFVVALVLEYTALSKRLVPSAINFLRGILYCCANTSILNPIQVVPPFRIHKHARILNLEEDCSKMEVVNKMAARDLVSNEIDVDFKIRCLVTSTAMVREFFDNFNDLEAQGCIFEPHLRLYSRIDVELYPRKVATLINETVNYMKGCLDKKTFTPLTEKKQPKLLRLYEPDVQEVFTGSKNAKLPREIAQRNILKRKIKRETKGVMRELRRDVAFISDVRMRQRIQSDNIRKQKVKQIYKDAAIQQGELNKLKRMK